MLSLILGQFERMNFEQYEFSGSVTSAEFGFNRFCWLCILIVALIFLRVGFIQDGKIFSTPSLVALTASLFPRS